MRNFVTAAVLTVAFFVAVPAAAQTEQADTLLLTTALWTGCPGMIVRVTTSPADTVTGKCGRVADGRLAVRTADTTRHVELVDVRSLEVRKSRIAESTLLLSVVGGIVGWSFGLRGEERVCVPGAPFCVEDSRRAEKGRGVGVGTVIGAAAGLLIGSRIKYWQERYR